MTNIIGTSCTANTNRCPSTYRYQHSAQPLPTTNHLQPSHPQPYTSNNQRITAENKPNLPPNQLHMSTRLTVPASSYKRTDLRTSMHTHEHIMSTATRIASRHGLPAAGERSAHPPGLNPPYTHHPPPTFNSLPSIRRPSSRPHQGTSACIIVRTYARPTYRIKAQPHRIQRAHERFPHQPQNKASTDPPQPTTATSTDQAHSTASYARHPPTSAPHHRMQERTHISSTFPPGLNQPSTVQPCHNLTPE